jgi:arylsulfatase A-like enzyme
MLVADHGEALGENGWFGHGATLWETVIHTPMVYVDFRKPRHRVVDTTVGTVDMMATLLDVVGVESGPNQGRSLMPAIRSKELDASEYVVEIEMRKEENRPAWYDVDRLALYYDDFKFEYVFGEGRLFDLAEDPDAVSPLDSSGEGEAIIATYLEGLAQEFLAEGNFASDSSLDDDTINQLKSLGYVQ